MVGCNESGIGNVIRSEIEKVTGMAADASTMDSLGNRHGAFDGWGMVASKVEMLLVVSRLDVNRSAEA